MAEGTKPGECPTEGTYVGTVTGGAKIGPAPSKGSKSGGDGDKGEARGRRGK